jgi:divalent metal cation (Fe/Co/Zn/Cd) transporter
MYSHHITNEGEYTLTMNDSEAARYLKTAIILSIITIAYNIVEGIVSVIFGYADETIALFGFGVDSFVEVVSGIGIYHMVWRMRLNPVSERDRFEKQALYVTGVSFFILALGLVIGSVLNVIYNVKPDTTIPGVIVSAISIITMRALYAYKMKVGTKLCSDPIIADANCTKTCLYLSFILLASSILYDFSRIRYIDIVGGLGIALFALREGKESIEKARSGSLSCACDDCEKLPPAP